MRTRPLPQRKSLGSGYNLRPDTERVQAQALRVGDVVMEDFEHPAIITKLTYPRKTQICIHANYIWQAAYEPSWVLGTFNVIHMFDRALPGEY